MELSSREKSSLPLPNLNVNVSVPAETAKESELVKSEQIVTFYNEVLDDIRADRREIDEVLQNFVEMVTNEGDASTSSKEALVNLLKLKSDTADKKTKVIDLLMRAFLKEKDTYPKFLNAHQHNQINIDSNTKRRQIIKDMEEESNGNK
jgi:hypothetical protein